MLHLTDQCSASSFAEAAGPRSFGNPAQWQSRRLWSLLDMINFQLRPFIAALSLIDQEKALCTYEAERLQEAKSDSLLFLSDSDAARIQATVRYVAVQCRLMSLQSADHRLERILTAFRLAPAAISYPEITQELTVLKQAIEDDIQYERFYHYPQTSGSLVLRVEADWAQTIQAFPSAQMRSEIDAGVDCYALQQTTAAVFHFMRIAEYGLRALGKERRIQLPKNKPIEWAMWNEILIEIDKAKKLIEQKAAGAKKDAALDFYSGALANFSGFKDQYRNMVMHVRRIYTPIEAEMAMRQVRDFMNKLSSKIGENTKTSLKWGL
jgi:hypothetical protein